MKFSVMITTRNRRDDLKRTLKVLETLSPAPHEILVCADACDDDTVRMVHEDHRDVRLFENPERLGSVASRRRLLAEATGDWVLSLDDDSYPLDLDFFEKARRTVAEHPEAAVVCFHEQTALPSGSQAPAPSSHRGRYVSAYANCGALMDLVFYRNQPGFPEFFEHMYEETDYALQCYAGGAAVWFEPSLTIRHHFSPAGRNEILRHQQNARNELWSAWMRCPLPWTAPVSAFRALRQLRFACTKGFGWAIREPVIWKQALLGANRCLPLRRTVPWQIYQSWMKLARKPIYTLTELEGRFGIRRKN